MQNHSNSSLPIIGSIAITALLVGGVLTYTTNERIDSLEGRLVGISADYTQTEHGQDLSYAQKIGSGPTQKVTVGAISFEIPVSWVVKQPDPVENSDFIIIKPDDGEGSVGGNEILISAYQNFENLSLKTLIENKKLFGEIDEPVLYMGENAAESIGEGLYTVKKELYRLPSSQQTVMLQVGVLPQNPVVSEEMVQVLDVIRSAIKVIK